METVPNADVAPAPAGRLTGREWRTAVELATSALAVRVVDSWPRGDEHPVMVLPGFMAGPDSTLFLRRTLRRLGYRTHDWGLGRNLGVRPGLEDAMLDKLMELYDRYGTPVSLIGWSAGGIYARELARQAPDAVRMVITLGSPFRGHPSSTRAWRFYKFMNRHDLTHQLTSPEKRAEREQPLQVPTTCIYSRKDGIVAWECCMSLPAERTENIEVDATHLGYGHHLTTLKVIADRLATHPDEWRPYAAAPPASDGGLPHAATG